MESSRAGMIGKRTRTDEINIQDKSASTPLVPKNVRKIGIFPRKGQHQTSNTKQSKVSGMEAERMLHKKRKFTKNSTNGTPNEESKRQRKDPRVQEICYCCMRRGQPCLRQTVQGEAILQHQPANKVNSSHGNLNGSIPRFPIGGIRCCTCGKLGHYFETCPKKDVLCFHCGQYGHYVNQCRIKRLTPLEQGYRLLMRQAEDDMLSRAMSRCSLSATEPRSDINK